MDNDNKETTRPRRRGPGAGNSFDKAKNFKSAILRLFGELRDFKVLIVVSLILAALSSVLSIAAPNRLSDLTDEISSGLVINSDNLEEISSLIGDNFNDDNLMETVSEILSIDISSDVVNDIMSSSSVSDEDKQEFMDVLSMDSSSMILGLGNLSSDVLNYILSSSSYKDVYISVSDKIDLLKSFSSLLDSDGSDISALSSVVIPDSVSEVLFDDIEVDGVVISSSDQVEFMRLFSSLDEDVSSSELYSLIDEMPDSIKSLVEPYMNIKKIQQIALFLVCLYVLSALFTYIESISMTDVANKFARKLRGSISSKINRLPLKYFDKHTTGDVLSRVVNDVDTIAQSMNQSLSTLVSSITLLIGTIIMMFVTNWIMALTAIISSLIGFVFMFLILGKSQKYFVARQVELGNLNGHIEDVYSGLNVVKAYNGKREVYEKFDEYNEKVYDANRKSQFLSGLMQPLMSFVGNLGYVAVCIVGALLTKNEIITFGVIIAFITYVRLFTSPLSQLAQATTSLQSTAAASERVFEFLDEEEMMSEEGIVKHLDKDKVKGKIEFKDVVFRYDGNDEDTIHNFNLVAEPGQKVAIVGPTGAGKTTMVNLLMKFYDIDSGDIMIDGVSTKELTRDNIHSLFTMILQDTWLFNGTIRENIVYNRSDISDDEVLEVCRVVGLDHFIKTFSKGLDEDISDNDSVSSGQKQLLTIARGMLENAPFLILDEATSNVDTRTEELVSKAMDRLTEGKTSFIIAHRLSTIKNADVILVMRDGKVVETGSHKELMKKNGFYADLYNSQFEL